MIVGLRTNIDPAYGPVEEGENRVIGVVVAKKFPEPKLVVETLERGAEAHPDAVWVVKSADAHTRNLCTLAGITPIELPSLKGYWHEKAPHWRDVELTLGCDWLLVFKKTGMSSSFEPGERVKVIERGTAPEKRRAGRKPRGV